MKFTCQQKDFLEALSVAQKAIGGTGTLPVLENILLSAEGQHVTLSATNLEIAIRSKFDAVIQNEGKTTLPAKTLSQWIGLAPDGELDIERGDGENIILKTKGAKTNIKGISAEEFPTLPVVEKEQSVTLSTTVLKKALDDVVFAAASSGTRPVLSGILFQSDGSDIALVGTDSYRLSEKKITPTQKSEGEISCIIPAKTLMELERILPTEGDAFVEVILSKNQILFVFDDVRLISRLIEGQFPNYKQILPKEHKNVVTVPRPELVRTIKRVGIFARENNNNIKLTFDGSELKITTDATEIGTEEASVAAEGIQDTITVALNSNFLLDILLVLGGDFVVFKTGEKLSPVAVGSEKNPNLLHIIMPLKV